MTPALTYASIILTAVVIVVAVACGVPLLHLVLPADTPFGQWAGVVCCLPILAALFYVGPWLYAAGWIGGLIYFTGHAAWHIRERG